MRGRHTASTLPPFCGCKRDAPAAATTAHLIQRGLHAAAQRAVQQVDLGEQRVQRVLRRVPRHPGPRRQLQRQAAAAAGQACEGGAAQLPQAARHPNAFSIPTLNAAARVPSRPSCPHHDKPQVRLRLQHHPGAAVGLGDIPAWPLQQEGRPATALSCRQRIERSRRATVPPPAKWRQHLPGRR